MGLPETREPQAVTSSVNKEHFQQQKLDYGLGRAEGWTVPERLMPGASYTDLVVSSTVLLVQERLDPPVTAVCTENSFLWLSWQPWEGLRALTLPWGTHTGH